MVLSSIEVIITFFVILMVIFFFFIISYFEAGAKKKFLVKFGEALYGIFIKEIISIIKNLTIKKLLFRAFIYSILPIASVFYGFLSQQIILGIISSITMIIGEYLLTLLVLPIFKAGSSLFDYMTSIGLNADMIYCVFTPFLWCIYIIFAHKSNYFSKEINYIIYIIIAIFLITSHYKVFSGMIISVTNIKVLKSQNHIYKKYSKYLGVVSFLFILLITLFCEVIIVSHLDERAFIYSGTNTPVKNAFDLFYFTTVTLATVGYGDAIPYSLLGKIMSLIIIISGMLLLVIYVGVIFSSSSEIKKTRFMKRKTGKRKYLRI